MTKKGLLFSFKESILTLFLGIAFISHFGPVPQITNLFLILSALYWITSIPFLSLQQLFLENRLSFFAHSTIFILCLLGLLYTDDFKNGQFLIERRLSFFLLPVLIFLSPLSRNSISKLFDAGLIALFISSLGGLINSLFLYQGIAENAHYLYSDNLVSLYNMQAVYYSFFINTSFILLFFQLSNQNSLFNKAPKWLLFLLAIYLFWFNVQLASRIGLFLNSVIISVYIISILLKKTNLKQGVLFGIGGVVLVSAMIVLAPKTINRFKALGTTEFQFDNPNGLQHFNDDVNPNNWTGLTARLAVWQCVGEVWKQQPYFGVGTGDVEIELQKRYAQHNFVLAKTANYNTHNQFLDVLLSFGIIGLIIYLLSLVIMVLKGIRFRNFAYLSFTLLLIVSTFTENMLNRNMGIVFIAMVGCLLARWNTATQNVSNATSQNNIQE